MLASYGLTPSAASRLYRIFGTVPPVARDLTTAAKQSERAVDNVPIVVEREHADQGVEKMRAAAFAYARCLSALIARDERWARLFGYRGEASYALTSFLEPREFVLHGHTDRAEMLVSHRCGFLEPREFLSALLQLPRASDGADMLVSWRAAECAEWMKLEESASLSGTLYLHKRSKQIICVSSTGVHVDFVNVSRRPTASAIQKTHARIIRTNNAWRMKLMVSSGIYAVLRDEEKYL